ncbi:MarR family transcriptional regulator [uncultured Ferrovibrio sp.]|jgi:DNA-binding MarR family transcriptional regulator|uniref:MarR family winged helix-turn-helix transcriptional regulator n=1 Tax=uncultured Ferrovibrio sp. TaxID=1576913 RepID=UPI002621B235|nr:MarR family transcriptional regulator [uncultured Ferrovibrio sp.]
MSGDTTTQRTATDVLAEFDLHSAPGHLLRRCQQLAVDLYTMEVGADGLTPRQFALLLAIHQRAGISQVDLVRETGIDRSTVAEMVARLIKRGLLVRQRTEADRRTNALALTPEGERQLLAAVPGVMRAQDRIMQPIPPAKRAEFIALLQQIIEALEPRQQA